MAKETKSDRFVRLAEARTNKVVKLIRFTNKHIIVMTSAGLILER